MTEEELRDIVLDSKQLLWTMDPEVVEHVVPAQVVSEDSILAVGNVAVLVPEFGELEAHVLEGKLASIDVELGLGWDSEEREGVLLRLDDTVTDSEHVLEAVTTAVKVVVVVATVIVEQGVFEASPG